MTPFLANIYEEYLQLDNSADCVDYLFAHPVLFSPARREELQSTMLLSEHLNNEGAYRAYHFAGSVYDALTTGKQPYMLGSGPIEPFFFSCDKDEISLATACSLVQGEEVYGLLSPLYVSRLCAYSDNLFTKTPDSWKSADKLLTIALAAAEATPEHKRIDEEWFDMWSRVIVSMLEMTTVRLMEIPDKRTLDKAVALGRRALEYAGKPGREQRAGKVLQRLGVLHLDPWFAGKSSTDYASQFNRWQRSIYHHDFLTTGVEAADVEVPEPREALEAANGYLEKAIDKQQGLEKAMSMKAFAEVRMWRYILKLDASTDKLLAATRAAIELMETLGFSGTPYTVLQNIMNVFGGPPSREVKTTNSVLHQLETEPYDILVGRFGFHILFDHIVQNIGLIVDEAPERALQIWQKSLSVLGDNRSGLARQYCTSGLRVMSALFKTEDAIRELKAGTTRARYDEVLGGLREKGEALSAGTYAVLLYIAYSSSGNDDEEEGIAILKDIGEDAFRMPELQPFITMHRYIEAELWLNAAVNGMRKNDLKYALEGYTVALSHFLQLGYTYNAHNILLRIEDIISQPAFAEPDAAVACLSWVALAIEKVNDQALSRTCQAIYKVLLQRIMMKGKVNILACTYLFQLMKGYAFNATLRSKWPENILYSKTAEDIIQKIEALSQNKGMVFSSMDNYFIEGEKLLLSYAGADEPWEGNEPRVRLQNLKITLDRYIYSKLIPETDHADDYLLTPEQLQALLPGNTVLLIQLLGPSFEGTASLYNLIFTREEVRIVSIRMKDLPSMVIEMSMGDKTIRMPALSLMAEETRDAIQDEPETTGLTRKARSLIRSNADFFLGGNILETLGAFKKQGKDHLCVWPHGPLHFFPFHLLPVDGAPICDQWKVSYVPSIGALAGRKTDNSITAEPRYLLSALGISFTGHNPYEHLRLGALENSVREATLIADTCKGNILTEQAVTEEAFIEAMKNSRWVHLSTHGVFDASAPSFQCLLLHEGAGTDGVLNAYELLQHRFDQVDLLTLSACQTALGRFDYSDNIRGLPAIFQQCGVKTIIGTLWECEVESSELFFLTLYTELNKGGDKLTAFTTAQQAVKEKFDNYRDWGVFYYTGAL